MELVGIRSRRRVNKPSAAVRGVIDAPLFMALGWPGYVCVNYIRQRDVLCRPWRRSDDQSGQHSPRWNADSQRLNADWGNVLAYSPRICVRSSSWLVGASDIMDKFVSSVGGAHAA